MDRLLSSRDVAERYGVTLPTARSYIRRIEGHMEKPLRVAEPLLMRDEASRQVWRQEPVRAKKRAPAARVIWIPGVSKIPKRA